MSLLEDWRNEAYYNQTDKKSMDAFWENYFKYEKSVYTQLLENPEEEVTGTVKELADRYHLPLNLMVGFEWN